MLNIDKKSIIKSISTNLPLGIGIDYLLGSVLNSAPLLKEFLKTGDVTPEEMAYYLIHPITNIQNALSNDLFMQAQPFILGLTGLMMAKDMFTGRKGKYEDASKYGAHGTARLATKRETYKKKNKKHHFVDHLRYEGKVLGEWPHVNRILVLMKKGLYIPKMIVQSRESYLNRNNLIVGGAGSGKTAGYIINNILHHTESSLVVTDPKGELYEKTSEAKREQGYKVRLINFKDIECSDRYNPFDYIRKETDALKVAKTIIMNSGGNAKELKGDFWDKAESALLSAFILFIKYTRPKEEHHFGSVFNLATQSYADVHELFRTLDKSHIARRAYAQAIEKLDDKVRANVFISLLVSLDLWKYQSVCEFTQKSDFMLADMGIEKTITYVILPIAEEEFRPLISTFFTQLFSELYSLADKHYNQLPVPVIMELDEFANIGKIPNFEERLSTTRSYRIEVDIVIQSLGQLRDRYGKDKANEIIDNCDIRMLLGTNELESAKYFSELTGKTTVRTQSLSESKNNSGASSGESESVTGKPLMFPDEILRMPTDEALLFAKGSNTLKIKKSFYFKNPHFNKMLQKTVSRYDYSCADRSDYVVYEPDAFVEALNKALEDKVNKSLEGPKIKEEDILPNPDHKTTLREIMEFADSEPIETKKTEEEEEGVLIPHLEL
jgi:type IV secretion system protein VirD4